MREQNKSTAKDPAGPAERALKIKLAALRRRDDAVARELRERTAASRERWARTQRAATAAPHGRARSTTATRSVPVPGGVRSTELPPDARVSETVEAAAQRRAIQASGGAPRVVRWHGDYSGRVAAVRVLAYR